MSVVIEDPTDSRLHDYRDLHPDSGRQRERHDECFIVEGLTAMSRLFQSNHRVRSILVAAPKAHRLDELAPLPDVPVYAVPQTVIERIAGFKLHRVALAAADRQPLPALDEILAASHRLAVLEGLNDVENLGAIARSARALGIDALVLDPQCTDPYYRRTVRVSMGEILLLPVARAAEWPADLERIASAGFETWALTPADDAESIWECAVPDRVAVLLGAEGPGLSSAALAGATRRVRIPLRRHRDDAPGRAESATGHAVTGADSLNVGHAAAVAFAALTALRHR